MSRPIKFPDPRERSLKEPAAFCSAQRVKSLYRQSTGTECQRISPLVKAWFEGLATAEGWYQFVWLKDVESDYEAGCMMSVAVVHFTAVPAQPLSVR